MQLSVCRPRAGSRVTVLEALELLDDVPVANGKQEKALAVASQVAARHGDGVVGTDQHEPILAEPGTRNPGPTRAPANDLERACTQGLFEPRHSLVEVADDIVDVMDAHARRSGPQWGIPG